MVESKQERLYGDAPGAINLNQNYPSTCVQSTFTTQIFSQAKERTEGKVVLN